MVAPIDLDLLERQHQQYGEMGLGGSVPALIAELREAREERMQMKRVADVAVNDLRAQLAASRTVVEAALTLEVNAAQSRLNTATLGRDLGQLRKALDELEALK